jgi:hypothetical protein
MSALPNPVRGPWYRKPLCWAGLCQTFRTESDDNGVWGECAICGQRAGYVDRPTLRRLADTEANLADGVCWTAWAGGECPLKFVQVEVRHRDGVIARGDACDFDPACWLNDGSKFDIVEYRRIR